MTREEWLRERKLGIGGSDEADVFSDKPDGCARRLFYDKVDVPPDYPIIETGQMKLGQFLEEYVAREYQARTGRQVTILPGAIASKTHPWMRVNIDRIITSSDHDSPGVLEIKTHGAQLFRKVKREGLKAGHLRQLQHAIYVTEHTWGAFAVLNRDNGEMITFDMDRDPELIVQLIEGSERIWDKIQRRQTPAPLEVADQRCVKCAWRILCRGDESFIKAVKQETGELEIDASFQEILADYRDAREMASDAKATLDLVEDEIKTRMGDRGAVESPGAGRIYYREQKGRRGVSIEALEAKYPEVAREMVKRGKPSRPLRVYLR